MLTIRCACQLVGCDCAAARLFGTACTVATNSLMAAVVDEAKSSEGVGAPAAEATMITEALAGIRAQVAAACAAAGRANNVRIQRCLCA